MVDRAVQGGLVAAFGANDNRSQGLALGLTWTIPEVRR